MLTYHKADPDVLVRLARIEWLLELVCGHQGMPREFLEGEWADHQEKVAFERTKEALKRALDK